MPARIIQNGGNHNEKRGQSQIKAPQFQEKQEITKEMAKVISEKGSIFNKTEFYAGRERLDLQGSSVQRVRDLQEENDHLQREIAAKEEELANGSDPLSTLADIEHRKIIIARNTGEILKIYLKNEERIKRIKDLEARNQKMRNEMMEMQGRFISTKDMDEKTRFASEFFVLKSEIERNSQEISQLNQK